MRYYKCSRCELNYILDGGTYCEVCRRELQGEAVEKEFCYICGKELDDDDIDICKSCAKQEGERHYDDMDKEQDDKE